MNSIQKQISSLEQDMKILFRLLIIFFLLFILIALFLAFYFSRDFFRQYRF